MTFEQFAAECFAAGMDVAGVRCLSARGRYSAGIQVPGPRGPEKWAVAFEERDDAPKWWALRFDDDASPRVAAHHPFGLYRGIREAVRRG